MTPGIVNKVRPEETATFRALQRIRIYHAQCGRCIGCDRQMPSRDMTRHHVILHTRGGPSHDGNICLLCCECHRRCHSGDQKEQHDALHAILVRFGYGPEARAEIYRMYQTWGVVGTRNIEPRGAERTLAGQIARWENEGGG